MTLAISGPHPFEGSGNLFLKVPEPATGSGALVALGPVQATGALDLVLFGPLPASGGLNLAGLRPPLAVGEKDLFIQGIDDISESLNLFTTNFEVISSGISLYIVSSGVKQTWPLYVPVDAQLVTEDMSLMTRGAQDAGTIFLTGSMDLVIAAPGDDEVSPTTFLNTLFLKVGDAGSGTTLNTWPLFLDVGQDPSRAIDLFINGGTNVASGDIPLSLLGPDDIRNWPLFLKGVPGTENEITLTVSGVLDPTLIGQSGTLVIKGSPLKSEELDLVLWSPRPEHSGSMTLFLKTLPLVAGPTTMELYTHGF
jgi:hypothetical protein